VSAGTAEERTLRIGEVADLVGITPRTIRYYEELGLLDAAPTRTKGAHRTYTEADVAQLQELIRLRDLLGLTLDELVTLAETEEARRALRRQWHDDPTDAERVEILDQAIDLAQRQLKLLQTRREKLEDFAAELDAKLRRLRRQRRELG
jgi:MerR family transcriptional regulator, repressor of the yfmOP operon